MGTEVDLTLLLGNAVTTRVAVTKTAVDGTVSVYDLTGATITFTADVGTTKVTYTEGAGITVPLPRTAGLVDLRLDGDHFPNAGEFAYVLDVLPAGSDDPDTVLYGHVVVTRHPNLDVAAIRRLVGNQVPPSDSELASAYARLGTHKAVALEVLEARYVALASGPKSWKIDGHYSEDRGDLKELRDFIDGIKAEVLADAGGGTMTVSHLARADRSR